MKPMLAHAYAGGDPSGFWMSEKLDGVRAIWNGAEFVSRNGNVFPCPPRMKEQMPKGACLDGEIFGGRGAFQQTVGRVRKGDWDGLEFVVFDAILTGAPFESRLAFASSITLPGWCRVLEHRLCSGTTDLDAFESEVLAAGGEGVMLRKAGSRYEFRRSNALLKVKRFRSAEAVVVGHQPGEGRHAGRLGALIVRKGDIEFRIGTGFTDDDRDVPPAIGSQVSFTFFELTDRGAPRFPAFLAVRDYEGRAA